MSKIPTRGILLDGKRGSGKSFTLLHVAVWAKQNGWLVVFEPNPSKYATLVGSIKRSNAGIYIQTEFATQFLQTLKTANESLLEQIPIKLEIYGNASLDGTHCKFARRMFEPVIEKIVQEELDAISRDLETPVGANETIKEQMTRLQLWHEYGNHFRIPSIKLKLENPSSVAEILNFGLENEAFATQALYEIMQQLKHQNTFPLLIIVDEFNECFSKSQYLSVRYDETKFNGWIPSYHLAMVRLFSHFDGAQYKRGLKLVATSWQRSKRRQYQPRLLGILPNEIKTIRNFGPLEFANYVHHLQETQTLHQFPSDKTNYFYMLTGGNGFESRRLLSMLY
ncbi:bifunctional Ribosomal protein S23-S29 [Babesia duncani]|uniref:Small ribosomal subunit protein mS29 n=1 Tax=Babesia duncani TaxID=323732 RepID=A0AAD9PLP2_9APIC|nr:bifunctional Ribosomal protein S23-S29 [Babesia duncani]